MERALAAALRRAALADLDGADPAADRRQSVSSLVQGQRGGGGWPALLSAAGAHALIPMVYYSLRHDGAAPADAHDLFRGPAILAAIRQARLQRALGEVLARLNAVGVGSIVLKGPALAATVYAERALRPYLDLDLWCSEADWAAIHRELSALGFVALIQRRPSPPPKVWGRMGYSHNVYYRSADDVAVEIHFAPWWHDLLPRLGAAIWDRSVAVPLAGQPTRILAPEDQLLQLAIHLHRHGYARLIWFSDLAHLLLCYPSLDWDVVIATARQEGFGLSVYASLRYLSDLLGIAAPAPALAALRPASPLRWLHQHYWPLSQVLDPPARPPVSFGFTEVPNATEVVLNLLLTGRRWEKGLYLARLLVPSTEWLAYFYDTRDPATLRRRRLVHAPKLLAKAVGELARGTRHPPGPGRVQPAPGDCPLTAAE
jgi:hypothetical protein